MSSPLVSVCVTTFNHEKYIAQCLESVFSQVVDFDVEVIVGEDDSSDDTLAICQQFSAKYQDRMTLICGKRADAYVAPGVATSRSNWLRILSVAQGDYIAFLDGDDYWIDEFKLKKQVEALRASSSAVLCFHRSTVWDAHADAATFESVGGSLGRGGFYSSEDVVEAFSGINSIAPMQSLLVSKDVVRLALPVIARIPGGVHGFIQFLSPSLGGWIYIDEVMAVYRKNVPDSMSHIKNTKIDPFFWKNGRLQGMMYFVKVICPNKYKKAYRDIFIVKMHRAVLAVPKLSTFNKLKVYFSVLRLELCLLLGRGYE